MLILLPPSEGKSAPRRGAPLDLASLSAPELSLPRSQVLDALVSLCAARSDDDREKAAKVLGIGTTQYAEVDRNAGLVSAPTGRAERIYTGVLYEALDLPSLSGAAKRRATQWVAITSSVFGLVRPSDRIPAYRLSGDVTLPGIGVVSRHWSRHLGPTVESAVGSGVLVDLRSTTYAAFWRPRPELSKRVVSVRVLHEHNGTRKVVSHFNKATKGRLVRALLEEGSNPRTTKAFTTQLRDLGWTVEDGERPGQLDVVVTDL